MFKKWIPTWAVPLLVIFAIGTVWLRLQVVGTTYSIHQVNQEINRLRQEQEKVLAQVSALRSPLRLEKLARTKFGLTKPGLDQVVYVKFK